MKLEKQKVVTAKPRRIENKLCSGSCDHCGEPLGKFVWVLGEATGCTKKHCLAEVNQERREAAEFFNDCDCTVNERISGHRLDCDLAEFAHSLHGAGRL